MKSAKLFSAWMTTRSAIGSDLTPCNSPGRSGPPRSQAQRRANANRGGDSWGEKIKGEFEMTTSPGLAACLSRAGQGLRVEVRIAYRFRATAILASTAERVEPSVCSNDSLGMLVTKGPISHPKPVGMSRVSEIDSHSTYTPPSRSTNRQ